MNSRLLQVAKGKETADLVIINGKIVNVYTGEIYEGGVAVSGNTIAAIGDVDYCIGPETKIIDAKKNYLTPGFIDGHIHPESSSMSIRNFAASIFKHGTTSIMTDLHEIGVVSGLEGIEAILEEAEITHVKLFFVVPSHVPFSPDLETSGAIFDSDIIQEALSRPDAVGLSECVGQYVLMEHSDLLRSMTIARSMGKSLQGHLPAMYGSNMNACLASGIATCHESKVEQDVYERLRNGCHLMMRQGSSASAKNLGTLINTIKENNLDTSMISIISDDLDTTDLQKHGHLDAAVRKALSVGVDFVKAIQMVTLHAARAFNLENFIGGLAPGKAADINITSGPKDFKVLSVVAKGELVYEDEEMLVSYPRADHSPVLLNTIKLSQKIKPESFHTKVPPSSKKIRALAIVMEAPYKRGREFELEVIDGVVQCDPEKDVIHIAQVERHGKNGNIGKAFITGFHLSGGALASSVGHDNHNIIVLGDNFDDMAAAVNHVASLGGGQAVVRKGKVEADVAYPICGLMSDLPLGELVEKKLKLDSIAREMGITISVPFMVLSFICLAESPDYAITDHGLIDVKLQKIIDPILKIIK